MPQLLSTLLFFSATRLPDRLPDVVDLAADLDRRTALLSAGNALYEVGAIIQGAYQILDPLPGDLLLPAFTMKRLPNHVEGFLDSTKSFLNNCSVLTSYNR